MVVVVGVTVSGQMSSQIGYFSRFMGGDKGKFLLYSLQQKF